MSDFDDNWQIVGAMPGVQPANDTAAVQPEVQPAPVAATPVQVQPQVQQAVPAAPAVQPNAVPYSVPGQTQFLTDTPVQPQYQAQPVAAPVQPQYQAQPVAAPVQPQYQAQPVAAPVQPQYQAMNQQPVYQQPYYGAPQQQGMPVYGGYAQPAYQNNNFYSAERDKNLNEIARMINHFSPKIDIYQKHDKCISEINRYSRTSVAPLVWGIIVAVIGLFVTYSAITAKYKDNIIAYSIIAGIFLLAGAGLIVLFVFKKKTHKSKKEALYAELRELSNELNLIYNGFSNCVLPSEFTDPRILYKIQSLIVSGRCMTINNAINSMLTYSNNFARMTEAKEKLEKDTTERFDGQPAFFNAVRYVNIR